jgi:hypothetical protein
VGQGTRRTGRLAIGLAALIFACVALAGPVGASAAVPERFYGISAFQGPSQAEFDRMSGAGIRAFRLPIEWRAVQPQEHGPFTFAGFDALVGGAARAGLEVVPLLYGSPTYLNPRLDEAPIKTTAQQQQYASFVTAVVRRYGAAGSFWAENPAIPAVPVRWWIPWNEPNLKSWWYPRPQPRRYVRLLRLTRDAARAADPAARIATAGIYRQPADGAGFSMVRYLKELYRVKGFKAAADAVSIHIFAPKPASVLDTAESAREIMNAARDRRTPLWINELAWATAGTSGFFRTSEGGQARRLGRTYRLLLQNRRRLRLDRVFWLAFRDVGGGSGSWIDYTGLNDSAGNPKPAWFTLARTAGGVP